jgi:hypothetical protein
MVSKKGILKRLSLHRLADWGWLRIKVSPALSLYIHTARAVILGAVLLPLWMLGWVCYVVGERREER